MAFGLHGILQRAQGRRLRLMADAIEQLHRVSVRPVERPADDRDLLEPHCPIPLLADQRGEDRARCVEEHGAVPSDMVTRERETPDLPIDAIRRGILERLAAVAGYRVLGFFWEIALRWRDRASRMAGQLVRRIACSDRSMLVASASDRSISKEPSPHERTSLVSPASSPSTSSTTICVRTR